MTCKEEHMAQAERLDAAKGPGFWLKTRVAYLFVYIPAGKISREGIEQIPGWLSFNWAFNKSCKGLYYKVGARSAAALVQALDELKPGQTVKVTMFHAFDNSTYELLITWTQTTKKKVRDFYTFQGPDPKRSYVLKLSQDQVNKFQIMLTSHPAVAAWLKTGAIIEGESI